MEILDTKKVRLTLESAYELLYGKVQEVYIPERKTFSEINQRRLKEEAEKKTV